ncbi:MAG: hypothetical protein RIT32_1117 [Actinomycetota bacterium]|jgi:CDP-diacylglycerol--glycerol-3-phosphate 3-phosphatidyltransferase
MAEFNLMNRKQYLATWQVTHSSPDLFVIRWFLTVVYFLAIALIKLRFSPNGATVFGGLVGASAAIFVYYELWLVAALVAMLSSLFDGVDGAIAEIKQQKTKFGAVLDVIMDRSVELIWFTSLIFAGASTNSVIWLGMLILIMEYVRTKANSLGIAGAGRITIAERPTRVIMFIMLNVGVFLIGTENSALTIGVTLLGLITAISTIQLFLGFTNQLRHNSSR